MLTITIPDDASIALTAAQVVEVRNDAAAAAIAEANTLREQVATVTRERDEARAEVEKYDKRLEDSADAYHRLYDSVIDALGLKTGDDYIAAIKALKAPPVVVPVPEVPAPVEQSVFPEGTGFTVTLDEAPGPDKDAMAREMFDLGRSMGFKWVRFLRNFDEVINDLQRRAAFEKRLAESGSTLADPRDLYALADRHDLKVAADTVDLMALRLSDPELKTYLEGLEKLGARLLVFNDANQYRDAKNPDGSLKYHPTALDAMVGRVRKFSTLPIMASLTVSANPTNYKPLFDLVEAQTFGKIGLLDDYLAKPFDAFCLDGQASASLDYLMKAHDVILKAKPKMVWWYTAFDRRTDWRNMPDKVALIEKTVKALEAIR